MINTLKKHLRKIPLLRKLVIGIDKILTKIKIFFSKIFSYKTHCNKNTKRCGRTFLNKNYKHAGRGLNNPTCCSTHLYIILKDIVSLLEKENIEYFAVYGTFLGAVRHQGIIPWDTDIDLAVSLDDKDKILTLLNKELGTRFYISNDNKHLVRINYSHKNRVHADIYFWGRNEHETIDYLYFQNIPLNELYPLKKRKFYDLEIYTPKTDYHLLKFYGNQYMNSAIKKYQSTKNTLSIKDNKPADIDIEKYNN